MSNSRNLNKDVDIDISGMLANVWRKKWWLLLLTLLSGVLFFIAFSTIPPRYSSESRIIIEKRESVFTQVGRDNFSATPAFDAETVGSQVQILNSTDLILDVIREADLVNAPEFIKAANVGGSILGDSDSSLTKEERVLKEFNKRLSTYAVSGTRVLNIEFWANDRALAKKVVNLMADKFIEANRSAKSSSTADATKWLEPQIEDLRTSVLDAEAKVAAYRSSSDILSGQNNLSLATQQLSEFSTELSRVRAAKSSAEGKVQSIKLTLQSGGSLDVIPEVIASPFIQRLRERQVSLKGEISELSTRLLPNHPRVKALQSQLADYEKQIRSAAQDIMKSLENNVDQAKRQEAVLLQEVNRLKAESSRVGEAEVELRALEREAASQRELLQSYLTRFREAASRQNSNYNPVDARIISRGTEAVDSHFPKVIPFTIAGMVSVLLLSIVALLTGLLLSGKAFKTEDEFVAAADPVDATHYTPAQAAAESVHVANAPSLAPKRKDLMIDDDIRLSPPTAQVANDQGFFAANVATQAMAQLGRGKIAIVTPGGAAGSMQTADIARGLINYGKSCAVVDLTGNGVTATNMLGSNQVSGLRNVLNGSSPLRDVLYKDNMSNAHVLASGNLINSELANNLQRLAQIIQALEENYDFVIIDCGHIGIDGLAKIADQSTMVLIPSDGAEPSECKQMERNLLQAGYAEAIAIKQRSTGSDVRVA